jgi:hypothetical protein
MASTQIVRSRRCFGLGAAIALALAGCDDTVTPTRGPTDVLGWVRTPAGDPIESAHVRIGEFSTGTGRDGFFRLPDVTVPYDLWIEQYGTSALFHGLQNIDPQVTIRGYGSSRDAHAYVTGRVPWQQTLRTTVFMFGPQVEPMFADVRDPTGTYLFQPRWSRRDVTPRIALFMLRDAVHIEPRFDAYATQTVRLADRGRFVVDADEPSFRPIVPRDVDVEVSYPQQAQFVAASLGIRVGDGFHYSFGDRPVAASGLATTLEAPTVPGLPLQVRVLARFEVYDEFGEARVPVTDAPLVRVELRAPPRLSAPPDSARVQSDAVLEWSDPQVGGVYAVQLYLGPQNVTIYTHERRLELGSIPLRDGFPDSAQCWWYVESLSAATLVDDLVVPPGAVAIRDLGWTASHRQTFSVIDVPSVPNDCAPAPTAGRRTPAPGSSTPPAAARPRASSPRRRWRPAPRPGRTRRPPRPRTS